MRTVIKQRKIDREIEFLRNPAEERLIQDIRDFKFACTLCAEDPGMQECLIE